MEQKLKEIAMQIMDDVHEAGDSGDLYLLYDRMVANAEDLRMALTSPQQVAQNTLQGEKHGD
jgi:hypothetical protein